MIGKLYFWRRARRGLAHQTYHVELALASLSLRRNGVDPAYYRALSA